MKKVALAIALLCMSMPVLAQKYKAIIDTKYGKMELMLNNETPLHTKNFVKIAKNGQLDSLLFHRVIPGFMIQGGDPKSKNAAPNTPLGMNSIGDRVKAEFNPKFYHKRGALAGARDNNPDKASSGSQFYIVVGKKYTDNELEMIASRTKVNYTDEQKQVYKTEGGAPHLDGNYTVFGQLTKGFEVLDVIASVPRNNQDRPLEDQVMRKVKIKKKFLFWYL